MFQNTNIITIAIPVYERKDFFLEALESALNQSVKCNVLVVDNASSHDYFETVCKEKGVKYYRNERNFGVFPNWNRCIKYAETEYVMLLGDDDILDKNYVYYFLEAKKKYNDIDIYFSDFYIYKNEEKTIKNHTHVLPFGYMHNGNKIIEYGIKYRLGFPVITSAIRKKIFTGFYEDAHGSNDWVWLYENIDKLTVYGEKRELLKYRQHKTNDSKNPITKNQVNLSIWYIYQVILKQKVEINNLSMISIINENIKYSRFYFFMNIEKLFFKNYINQNNRYSLFLKQEFNKSSTFKCLMIFPLKYRKFICKIFYKLKLIQ